MRKRKPWETGPVEPRRTRPPSSSTPGPRSWSRREGRLQNSPRRLGRGDRRLPTHDRRADARGSGRQHWICEHHVACPPGVGKTHLAISLAITAVESGRKIYFGPLTDLVDSLEEAKAAGRLNRRLKTLTHPALLVVDEIGYLPVTQSGAVLFFQLINRPGEAGATAGAMRIRVGRPQAHPGPHAQPGAQGQKPPGRSAAQDHDRRRARRPRDRSRKRKQRTAAPARIQGGVARPQTEGTARPAGTGDRGAGR